MLHDCMEHHACLQFDEPEMVKELFKRGVKTVVMDLRGRTSLSKTHRKIPELGMKKLFHSFVGVSRDAITVHNIDELDALIEQYHAEGAENLYINRLVVYWSEGDADEWHRNILHGKAFERSTGNNRKNVLTMKVGMLEKVRGYQDRYGDDLVQPTVCELMERKPTKRFCHGLVAKETR